MGLSIYIFFYVNNQLLVIKSQDDSIPMDFGGDKVLCGVNILRCCMLFFVLSLLVLLGVSPYYVVLFHRICGSG